MGGVQQELPLGISELEARMSALPNECDVMLLSELDGFLAGIVVCPDQIPPAEWLPMIWGGGDPEVAEGCAFADVADFNAFCQLVIAHYNGIVRDLQRGQGSFAPVYEVDTGAGEVLWEIWLSGLTQAMALRPQSWQAVARCGDEDAETALATLVALAGAECDEAEPIFTGEQMAEITSMAQDMIPYCVEKLHGWRLQRDSKQPRQIAVDDVVSGSGELCACESGRDHKVCCGAN